MQPTALFLAAFGFLSVSCASIGAAQLPGSTPTAGPTLTVAATATASPTATATATATPSPSATPLPISTATRPPAPTATPPPTREAVEAEPAEAALAVSQPPATEAASSATVQGGTSLPLPGGTTVRWGGCASDGTCYPYNFYWAPTHEVVMQNGEGQHKVQHELCHAHQHWSINGGAPLDPSDYDLESWYATPQGQSFTTMAAALPWPWTHSAVSGLEDFAWTCAYWYLDPVHLLQASPDRYAWAAANLP